MNESVGFSAFSYSSPRLEGCAGSARQRQICGVFSLSMARPQKPEASIGISTKMSVWCRCRVLEHTAAHKTLCSSGRGRADPRSTPYPVLSRSPGRTRAACGEVEAIDRRCADIQIITNLPAGADRWGHALVVLARKLCSYEAVPPPPNQMNPFMVAGT